MRTKTRCCRSSSSCCTSSAAQLLYLGKVVTIWLLDGSCLAILHSSMYSALFPDSSREACFGYALNSHLLDVVKRHCSKAERWRQSIYMRDLRLCFPYQSRKGVICIVYENYPIMFRFCHWRTSYLCFAPWKVFTVVVLCVYFFVAVFYSITAKIHLLSFVFSIRWLIQVCDIQSRLSSCEKKYCYYWSLEDIFGPSLCRSIKQSHLIHFRKRYPFFELFIVATTKWMISSTSISFFQ